MFLTGPTAQASERWSEESVNHDTAAILLILKRNRDEQNTSWEIGDVQQNKYMTLQECLSDQV